LTGHLLECDAPAKYHFVSVSAPARVWMLILEILRYGLSILNEDGGVVNCLDEWGTVVSIIDMIEGAIGLETYYSNNN
jgi:hypothetical protein